MASQFQHQKVAGVFAAMDTDSDGYLSEGDFRALSRPEFTEHWTEFWAGDNPAAPGSWVFGFFPADAGHE
jgi:hypothetical protein